MTRRPTRPAPAARATAADCMRMHMQGLGLQPCTQEHCQPSWRPRGHRVPPRDKGAHLCVGVLRLPRGLQQRGRPLCRLHRPHPWSTAPAAARQPSMLPRRGLHASRHHRQDQGRARRAWRARCAASKEPGARPSGAMALSHTIEACCQEVTWHEVAQLASTIWGARFTDVRAAGGLMEGAAATTIGPKQISRLALLLECGYGYYYTVLPGCLCWDTMLCSTPRRTRWTAVAQCGLLLCGLLL